MGHRFFSMRFQSLSGFFRPCNPEQLPEVVALVRCFNPCRVFSGLATEGLLGVHRVVDDVSIPVGFFQALQLNAYMTDYPEFFNVSIPVGFFQALQLKVSPGGMVAAVLFQSLSGFFRPCNTVQMLVQGMEWAVSIPVGFFQALQPNDPIHASCLIGSFQSLSGFFRPCNGSEESRGRPPGHRFNPCRVFSGLATQTSPNVQS